MIKILAGIVLYNPEIERLIKEIESVKDQVDEICLYNNGSQNLDEIKKGIYGMNLTVLNNTNNMGIGYALNRIFEYAKERGYSWVLTLDHDTICPHNLIFHYKKYINIIDLGMLCPSIVDKKNASNAWQGNKSLELEKIERCIQSGALVNVEMWDRIGGFDEWMFVDFVDFDFCKKVIVNKYLIYRCNRIFLDHEFGEKRDTLFSKQLQYLYEKYQCKLFKLLSYKNVYSSTRVFYCTRNNIVYIKKYKQYNNNLKEFFDFIRRIVARLLRGDEKIMLLRQSIKGIYAGLKHKTEGYVCKRLEE